MPFRECTLRSSKQNEVCAFLNSSSTHFPLSITPLWPGFAKFVKKYISIQDITYRKVSSRSTSPLVAHPMILVKFKAAWFFLQIFEFNFSR